jgi:PAS domain S-box-containing protein
MTIPVVGRTLCLTAAAVGALALLGWVADIPWLFTIVPGHPPMMPNTAVGLLLGGVAGASRVRSPLRRWLERVAAAIVLFIGVATVAEYALSTGFGIDELLWKTETGPFAGRPSPPTAIALACLGAALLLRHTRPMARVRPSEWLFAVTVFAGYGALLGHVFGAAQLYRLADAPVMGVALPAGLGLMLAGIGALLEHPGAGLMRVATSAGPGGLLLRRLVPAIALGPPVIGLVVTRLFAALGVVDDQLVLGTMTAAVTLVGLALLAATALTVDRLHDELAMNRTRLQELVEQASDGIFLATHDGRYTDVNDAGHRLLGYPPGELIGKSILDLIPPDNVERLWRSHDRQVRGETDISEWMLRRKNGEYVPVEVSAKVLPDGRWQGFVRDISERKRAEQALRESEAHLRFAAQAARFGSFEFEPFEGLSRFSPELLAIFGVTPAEVPEHLQPDSDWTMKCFHPDDRARLLRKLETSLDAAGTGELHEDARIPRSDGALRWARIDARVVTEGEGADRRPVRIAGTVLDVTDQKRRENEQRLLAELGLAFASTLDYAATLVNVAQLLVRDLADYCIVDIVEKDTSVRRVEVAVRDPARERLREAFLKMPLDRMRPHLVGAALITERAALFEEVEDSIIASWAQSEEHLAALRALEARSVIVVPLHAHGKLLGAMALIASGHSRKYDEADLRLAEEIARRAATSIENARLYRTAQRAIRARDDVLAVVAHDLRSPLNTILLQAQLLGRDGPEPERRSQKPGAIIERAAGRMTRLINDLLDVARMEAGRLSIDRAPVAVNDVLSLTVEAKRPIAAAASLEVELDVAPNLPAIWADRHRLLQVLENLIGNAIKFTPAGGRISVGAKPRGREISFWVADTGPGISPDDLPHVFDRFWQTREARPHGAGLGLAIVKGLVEAHGGRIWAESRLGHGTTFHFTVPRAPRATFHRAPSP